MKDIVEEDPDDVEEETPIYHMSETDTDELPELDPDATLAILQRIFDDDLETEKGFYGINFALDVLLEDYMLDENYWMHLSLEKKKEVFEILLKIDYGEMFEDTEETSESTEKAVAKISEIIGESSEKLDKDMMSKVQAGVISIVEDYFVGPVEPWNI